MQLQPAAPSANVGVIVGRFQVHELHDGHRDLIDSVAARHPRVIIFLGSKPGVLVTRNNPLDFQCRKAMIQASYPEVTILPIPDQPTDSGWSADLDRRIQEVTEGYSVLLYGSRDGFVPAYSGVHPVIELAAAQHVSGTDVRKSVSRTVRADPEFRRGVVYAAFNRHPVSYQCVDSAVHDPGGSRILLGRKRSDPEGQWRFFGGFAGPEDASLEAAASRELHEEAGGMGVHPGPKYLGSFRVDDFRYRGEQDSIMTALFLFEYFHGPVVPGDDMDEAKWFCSVDTPETTLVEAHRPLFRTLMAYLNGDQSNA